MFAERVYERLGEPDEISIESDGQTHTWIEADGLCFDAQCIKGVYGDRANFQYTLNHRYLNLELKTSDYENEPVT